MILGITTLLIAVVISVVSAYYSILGLTAIFAAAAIPVMIMGASLEAGKVITAVWLHANWKRAELQYKLYLVPAICFLMALTSMGVFGFLSKAHLDQGVPTGDIAAQVQIFDEKIKTQKDNIESARSALKQMDAAVDQTMARSTSEDGATRSANLRRSQQKERGQLQNDITKAQNAIVKLQEERAPIAAQARKVEAEVGPVKYIAALIYGDNPDANLLESAVRWVIILIVVVFDPLAIVLILAGIKQLEWSRPRRNSGYSFLAPSGKNDVTVDELIEEITPENKHQEIKFEETTEPSGWMFTPTEPVITEVEDLNKVNEQAALAVEQPDLEIIEQQVKQVVEQPEAESVELVQARQDVNALVELVNARDQELEQIRATLAALDQDYQLMADSNSRSLTREYELTQQLEQLQHERNHLANQLAESIQPVVNEIPQAAAPYKAPVVEVPATAIPQKIMSAPVVEIAPIVEEPIVQIETNPYSIDERPGDYIEPPVHQPRADFGTDFPTSPEKGDMFLRTDFKPSRLFKWNDIKWIEVNKKSTDAYSYNDAYIQFLAEKVSTGEYSFDELNDVEQQQVQQVLGGLRG